jgi:hypothetical protein
VGVALVSNSPGVSAFVPVKVEPPPNLFETLGFGSDEQSEQQALFRMPFGLSRRTL